MFPVKTARGHMFLVVPPQVGKNPWIPALNDSPVNVRSWVSPNHFVVKKYHHPLSLHTGYNHQS